MHRIDSEILKSVATSSAAVLCNHRDFASFERHRLRWPQQNNGRSAIPNALDLFLLRSGLQAIPQNSN